MPTERLDLPRPQLAALCEQWDRLDNNDRIIFAELLRIAFQINSTRPPDRTIVCASLDRAARNLAATGGEVTAQMYLSGGGKL